MGMGTVGLSILLENHHHQHHQPHMNKNNTTKILSKFSLPKPPPSSSNCSSPLPSSTFLDSCFLCKTSLSPSKDIYMYRGDRAFCSVECRCKQIFLDESREKLTPSSSSSSSKHGRERRKIAVGFGL